MLDVVFKELSRTKADNLFDIRITLAQTPAPTWEGTKCGSYARIYAVHEKDKRLSPAMFRYNVMLVANTFLVHKYTVCVRGMFQQDKAFVELWLKASSLRDAKPIAGDFTEYAKSVFKEFIHGKTIAKVQCIEHKEGQESVVVRRPQDQHPRTTGDNSNAITRNKPDEAVQKLQTLFSKTRSIDCSEIKMLLKKLSPDPANYAKGHERLREFLFNEDREYDLDALDALARACVLDLVRYENKNQHQINGYSIFSKYYIPAFLALAEIE